MAQLTPDPASQRRRSPSVPTRSPCTVRDRSADGEPDREAGADQGAPQNSDAGDDKEKGLALRPLAFATKALTATRADRGRGRRGRLGAAAWLAAHSFLAPVPARRRPLRTMPCAPIPSTTIGSRHRRAMRAGSRGARQIRLDARPWRRRPKSFSEFRFLSGTRRRPRRSAPAEITTSLNGRPWPRAFARAYSIDSSDNFNCQALLFRRSANAHAH